MDSDEMSESSEVSSDVSTHSYEKDVKPGRVKSRVSTRSQNTAAVSDDVDNQGDQGKSQKPKKKSKTGRKKKDSDDDEEEDEEMNNQGDQGKTQKPKKKSKTGRKKKDSDDDEEEDEEPPVTTKRGKGGAGKKKASSGGSDEEENPRTRKLNAQKRAAAVPKMNAHDSDDKCNFSSSEEDDTDLKDKQIRVNEIKRFLKANYHLIHKNIRYRMGDGSKEDFDAFCASYGTALTHTCWICGETTQERLNRHILVHAVDFNEIPHKFNNKSKTKDLCLKVAQLFEGYNTRLLNLNNYISHPTTQGEINLLTQVVKGLDEAHVYYVLDKKYLQLIPSNAPPPLPRTRQQPAPIPVMRRPAAAQQNRDASADVAITPPRATSPLPLGYTPPLFDTPSPFHVSQNARDSDDDTGNIPSAVAEFAKIGKQYLLEINSTAYDLKTGIHRCFTDFSNPDLIFSFDNDGGSTEKIKGRTTSWRSEAVRYGWSIVVRMADQPMICAFAHEEDGTAQITADPNSYLTIDNKNSVNYIRRMAALILRSRGRIGGSLCVFDLIYSHDAVRHICDTLIGKYSPESLACMLKNYKKFVSWVISKTKDKYVTHFNMTESVSRLFTIINSCVSKLTTSSNMRKDLKKQIEVSTFMEYPIQERIVTADRIMLEIIRIGDLCEKNNSISRRDYEFTKNTAMTYLIVMNSQRNEIAWKLKNRGIFQLGKDGKYEIREPMPDDPDFKELYSGFIENPKGSKKSVGRKYSDLAGSLKGYFGFGFTGKLYLMAYFRARDVLYKMRKGIMPDNYNDPRGLVFYTFEGKPIRQTQVSGKVNAFAASVDCYVANHRLGCNPARHTATEMAFEKANKDAAQTYGQVARLQHHTQDVASTHYLDNCQKAAVQVFSVLRKVVEKEIASNKETKKYIEKYEARIVAKLDAHIEKLGRSAQQSDSEDDIAEIIVADEEEDEEEEGEPETQSENGHEEEEGDADADRERDSDFSAQFYDNMDMDDIGGGEMPMHPYDTPLAPRAAGKKYPHSREGSSSPRAVRMVPKRHVVPAESSLQPNLPSGISEKNPTPPSLPPTVPPRTAPPLPAKTPRPLPKPPAFVGPPTSPSNTLSDLFKKLQPCPGAGSMSIMTPLLVKESLADRVEWEKLHLRYNSCDDARSIEPQGYEAVYEGLAGLPAPDPDNDDERRYTNDDPDFIKEGDLDIIAQLISHPPVPPDVAKEQMEKFKLIGSGSNALHKALFEAKKGPRVEQFPWTVVKKTRGIGLGLFAVIAIPTNTVIGLYTGRFATVDEANAYFKEQKKRAGDRHTLYKLPDEYHFEMETGQGKVYIEGFRRTHRGVAILARYMNSSSDCKIHCNVRAENLILKVGNIHVRTIVFKAIKDITPGEPLMWNYDTRPSKLDKARKDQLKCPMCELGEPGAAASDPENFKLEPIFGKGLLSERAEGKIPSSQMDSSTKKVLPYLHDPFIVNVPITYFLKAMATYHKFGIDQGSSLSSELHEYIPTLDASLILPYAVHFLACKLPIVRHPEDKTGRQLVHDLSMTSPLNVKTTLQTIFDCATRLQTRVLLYARDQRCSHVLTPVVLAPPNSETWRVDAIIGMVYTRDSDTSAHFAIMGWDRGNADETRVLTSLRMCEVWRNKGFIKVASDLSKFKTPAHITMFPPLARYK